MDLRPARPTRRPKRTFLVYVENQTQRAYLEWLKAELDHPLLTVRHVDLHARPEDWLRSANRARSAERRKGTYFDEVWCLIDVPDADRLAQLLEVAGKLRVRLAASAPDFNHWLELHFEPDSGGDLNAKTFRGESSSAVFASAMPGRLDGAVERSRLSAEACTVHWLVEALQDSIARFGN
jgi:hypothetical protein